MSAGARLGGRNPPHQWKEFTQCIHVLGDKGHQLRFRVSLSLHGVIDAESLGIMVVEPGRPKFEDDTRVRIRLGPGSVE